MTAKITEEEFRKQAYAIVAERLCIDDAVDDLEGLAVRAGLEFTPEPIDPSHGALLTEGTKLVDGLGVVTASEMMWQYNAPNAKWYGTDGRVRDTDRIIKYEGLIIFIPKRKETN